MIEGWKKVTLEEISTKIGDGLHGTPKYDELGEYYFVNGNNLENGKIVIKAETKKISFEQYDKIKKELNDRTILVAINGTLGNLGFYSGEPIALGKSACYINLKNEVNKYFIRYVLEFEHFQNYAYLFATGSTIKNLGLKAVRKYPFFLPPLPTQRKIASILSAYDDLIENNLKRVKLLEEKAQLTYEEWFVRMKFPGHETTTINKETGLPEGWEKTTLDYLCEKITDGTHDSPKQAEQGIKLITGKHIDRGFVDFESAYLISQEDHNKIKKRSEISKGDILFSNIGTLGNIGMVTESFEYSCKNVIIFKYKQGYSSFLFCYLSDQYTRMKLDARSSGVAQKFYSLTLIRNYKEYFPKEDFIYQFDQAVKPLIDLKFQLNYKNQKLKEARDILLPRLMTGMIDVEQMNIETLQPTTA